MPEDLESYFIDLLDTTKSRYKLSQTYGTGQLTQEIMDANYRWDYSEDVVEELEKYFPDLSELPSEKHINSPMLNAQQLKDRFNQALRNDDRFEGWKADISDKRPYNIFVSQDNKAIQVGIEVKRTELQFRRLLVHEIGTHVLRSVKANYSNNPLIKNAILPDYILLEEGLAVYSEWKEGLLSKEVWDRYRSRHLAVITAKKHSFLETFHLLGGQYPHTSPNELFITTMRVKRGFIDGRLPGAYPKGSAYKIGFAIVNKLLEKHSIEDLMTGKFGINELKLIEYDLL
ncbi:MAG: tyrosine/phenylalanine carboxypeptidase domain-containing protein [Candidatus Dojkabacteria bacterium]